MDSNLNNKGIDTYCSEFTEKILADTFDGKDKISGQEILTLTPIRQVNLFVVKNLFFAWKDETQKIRSPYFDYENTEVRKALRNFMNVLSKHISIDKTHLKPLLLHASKEAILLIFSPYGFYTHQISDNETLSIETLKSIAKYVKTNENIFKALIEHMESESLNNLNHDELIHHLNQIFENTDSSPVDLESYLNDFSKVIPLEEGIIYGEAHKKQKLVVESVKQKEENPEIAPKAVLNDELIDEEKTTLADIHQQQKIHSIEKHLSINQRFMFIRALFGGDENAFRNAVTDLENMSSKSEAFNYLNNNYPDWDKESEEVEEFMEIVEKRLS